MATHHTTTRTRRLRTSDVTTRVFTLLHEARPVLLDLGGAADLDLSGWGDRVRRVDAVYTGGWVLPVLGEVPAPAAVLIRPDGYVAWIGALGDDGLRGDGLRGDGLRGALTTWFGPPHPVDVTV